MAGAFSMAAGEYVSMRTQREMFEHQIDLEREELAQCPQEEAQELTLIYMARGMQAEEAAALSSFLSFLLGGAIPLLPYLFMRGPHVLHITVALTALALFSVGAVLSLFSGKSPWYGGLRMLLIGAAAGTLTYMIGALVGVSVA